MRLKLAFHLARRRLPTASDLQQLTYVTCNMSHYIKNALADDSIRLVSIERIKNNSLREF